jgi:hypothetical protein
VIEHYLETAQRTVTVMVMDFTRIPAGMRDDGLPQNPCYPKDLSDDPGFACKPHCVFYFISGQPYLMLRSALD